MVVIKYKKINEGMFFSHLSMLRLMNRLLSISGVEVKYSEGFNKTRRIYFSSPTRVGVESVCEYLTLDTMEEAKDIKVKMQNHLPSWLQIVEVYDVENKFNVASLNTASRYSVTIDGYKSLKEKIKQFFERESIVTKVIVHGEEKQIDVKNRIYEIKYNENSFNILAGVGANSVRVDELVKEILKFVNKPELEFKIVKEELFTTNENQEFVNIDDLLEELSIDK